MNHRADSHSVYNTQNIPTKIPTSTFTEDSSDEDKSSERTEGFSIEELESALISESEEGLANLI